MIFANIMNIEVALWQVLVFSAGFMVTAGIHLIAKGILEEYHLSKERHQAEWAERQNWQQMDKFLRGDDDHTDADRG